MKKEYATIVRNTIKEIAKEDKNWKWSLKGNTIHWEYGVEFEIVIGEFKKDEILEVECQVVETKWQGDSWIWQWVGNEFYMDYKTTEDALKGVVESTMRKAMHLF